MCFYVHALCVCMCFVCMCMCVFACAYLYMGISVVLGYLLLWLHSLQCGLEVFSCQCSGLYRSLVNCCWIPTPVIREMCFSPWLEFYLPIPWKRSLQNFKSMWHLVKFLFLLMTEDRLPVRKDCVSQVDPGLLVAHRWAALPESERMFHGNAGGPKV